VPSLGEIYVGAAIEEWSERRVIESVHASLSEAGEPFILMANFHVDGRQVDCVVATARQVTVLEIKNTRLPVRGGVDGDWERLHASGRWLRYTNGYRQALTQKNRLRDAMGRRRSAGSFYPNAAVVFAEPLPAGSMLTSGDFKVTVSTLEQLHITRSAGDSPWSLDDWLAYIRDQSLKRIDLAELMGGPALEQAFDLVREFRAASAEELDRAVQSWLPESDEQRNQVLELLDTSPGGYVNGPSGCGKTLAARWLARRMTAAGECVILLAAKDYDGSWAQLLRRELALVADASLTRFLNSLRATGCPVRIIVDGVNEFGADRAAALRGLRAIARRLEARVIVTGQSALPDQLAGLATISIAAPSLALKERIASESPAAISGAVRDLLKAVTSGFEAAIVGEIGTEMLVGASRQLLVDQFIRKRLGQAARSGSAGLRRFAERLVDTTTFSMGENEFDELMIGAGVGADEVDTTFAAGILAKRSGRVSFAHEILLNACAAHAFAQHALVAGAKFAHLLALPALEPLATDILSVIEDGETVTAILETTSSAALLFEAAQGLAGPLGEATAKGLLDRTEAAIKEEIGFLRLAIQDGDNPAVHWDAATLREWSDPERARIEALAREVGNGYRIDRYFALCAVMDAALLEERRRLFDAASTAGIHALKSESYRLAYQGFLDECGMSMLSRTALSGIHDIVGTPKNNPARDMMSLTSGQLHFYLQRRRLFLDHISDDDLADGLTATITQRFRYEPYHVKLELMHAAVFARQASPEKLQALIEAIETIDANRESLFISSSIVDSLKFLGALGDSAEAARDGIREQFVRATGEAEDEIILDLALTVSVTMFDHPYDYIYGDEFEALATDKRRLLMRRAARAPDARNAPTSPG